MDMDAHMDMEMTVLRRDALSHRELPAERRGRRIHVHSDSRNSCQWTRGLGAGPKRSSTLVISNGPPL